jgi:hypothetical protein
MACFCISIESETFHGRFHRALNRAGTVASDMIEVRTKILDGAVMKVVRTDCPWAIAVFRSIGATEGSHD